MTIETIIKGLNMDRYDRNARLRPALLTILPLLLLVAIWYPAVWSLIGGLVSLVVGCGALFFLAQIARQRGRALETYWKPAIGRAHSAIILSHGDETLSAATKTRYHACLAGHGLVLPSVAQEKRDSAKAHSLYLSAIDWLLERCRTTGNASLLLDENIAYGFRRNLRGLKPIALVILLFSVAAGAALLRRAGSSSPRFEAGLALEAILVLMAGLWVGLVTKAFVVDASTAYAQRLLAQCDAGIGGP